MNFKGAACAIGAGLSFSVASSLAKLSYFAGSNPWTIVTVRSLVPVVILALWLWISRRALLPPSPERLRAVIVGVLVLIQSLAHYSAFRYIHLGLAILVFFLFTIFTLFANAIIERRRPTGRELSATGLAFVGLAIALAPARDDGIALGVGLALLAAVTFTALIILSSRWFKSSDARPRTLVILATVGLPLAFAGQAGDLFAVPTTPAGLWALAGVPIFYFAGFLLLMHAARVIGPVLATMLLNIEPVATMLLASVVEAKPLVALQWFGGALVFTALFVATVRRRS